MIFVLISLSLLAFTLVIYFDKNKSFIKRSIYFVLILSLFFILKNFLNAESSQNLILLNNNSSENSQLIASTNAKVLDFKEKNLSLKELLEYKSISLLGEGLSEQNRTLFALLNFNFYPNSIYGFLEVNYKHDLYIHETINLNIKINTRNQGLLTIKGFGKTLDSIYLGAGLSDSTLNFKSDFAGQYLYELSFKASNSSEMFNEKLALEINETPKYSILILMAKQNAEWKFLSRYLEEQGHFITSRINYGVGNDKWQSNSKEYQFNKFDERLLKATDIILSDFEALESLNSQEKSVLNKIADEKTSLIFISSEKQLLKINNSALEIEKNEPKESDTIKYFGTFKANKQFEFSMNNKLAKVLKNNTYYLTPFESYPLYLNGRKEYYANFWSEIFKSIQITQKELIETEQFVNVYQTTNINLRSTEAILEINDKTVKLEQDLLEPDLFKYTFISDSSAWYQLSSKFAKKAIYIYPENAFLTLKKYHKMEATKKIASNELKIYKESFFESIFTKIFFICLFFLSLLVLWFYEKFFN